MPRRLSAIPTASWAASAMSSSSESMRSARTRAASCGRMLPAASIAASSRSFVGFLRGDQVCHVRPGRLYFPIARRQDGLVVDVRVRAVQRFEDLLRESANEAHPEDGGELPEVVVAGVCGAYRVLVPVLRGAYRCLQDPPPHFLGNAGVPVELLQRLLDRVERPLRNWNVVGIPEPVQVGLFENRSQGDRRLAARLLGLIAAAQDGEQRVDQIVVDHGELTGQIHCQREIGFREPRSAKDIEQHRAGILRPFPGRSVLQSFQIRFHFYTLPKAPVSLQRPGGEASSRREAAGKERAPS